MSIEEQDYLALSDSALLAQCEVDTYRASGPGGQKRNKTSSAVRLRHGPTGLSASASDSRSQHDNRRRALRRLRRRIAVEVRRPVDPAETSGDEALVALCQGRSSDGRRSDAYCEIIQRLLDLFVALNCSVADTARRLGVRTAALSKVMTAEAWVLRAVNHQREQRGLRPLR